MKIFIWNVSKASILCTIDCHPEVILSVSWNYNGSRIVTSCKDKLFRVIDARSGEVLKVGERACCQGCTRLFDLCSQATVTRVANRLERFIYAMVASSPRVSRGWPNDSMPCGTR